MKNKKPVLIWGGIILFLLIYIFSNDIFRNKTNQQPAVDENIVKDQIIDFKKFSINDLPADGSFIETQGTIIQKGESIAIDKSISYYFKIEDGSSTVLVMPKDNVFNNFNIGDLISVKGAVGTLGDCTKTDNPQIQKICYQFKLATANIRVIVPIKLLSSDTDISVIKKSSNIVDNTISKSVVEEISPVQVQQSISSLTFTKIMSGLSNTFTMGEFTNGKNHGYSSDNNNLLVELMIFGRDKQNISGVTVAIFDPSVGFNSNLITFPTDFSTYKSLHDKVLSQLLTNILPNWADRVEWVNGAVATCKQSGTEQVSNIVKDSMKITLSCNTQLGSYGIDIKSN